MPARTDHPAIEPSTSIPTAIWRYMDFTKFVALLESKALYFSRADRLNDAFEGSLPSGDLDAELQLHAAIAKKDAQLATRFKNRRSEIRRSLTTSTYINCWHASRSESAAMWKLYARTEEAVAIRSDFSLLHLALPDDVLLGQVSYVDFSTTRLKVERDPLVAFFNKRLEFKHEQEIRAVLDNRPNHEATSGVTPAGLQRAIDLHSLIQSVHIAPTAADWFVQLVSSLCRKYGLRRVPVIGSSLDAKPFF